MRTIPPASDTDKAPLAVLDRFFAISSRGSNLGSELRGGVITFVTMSYILVLNPLILGGKPDIVGRVLPIGQVAAATALVAGVMSLLFGLVANYPFALAAGLGINALLAVSVVRQLTWPEAMGVVVVEGVIIVVLGATGLRLAVFRAIPPELRAAIAVGIGCFIAMVGLVDAGFVRRVPDDAHTTVPVSLGSGGFIATWPTAVFVGGLALMAVLVANKVRGALLIGIVVTTSAAVLVQAVTKLGSGPSGWDLVIPQAPQKLLDAPDFALIGDVDPFGAFGRLGGLACCLLVFTVLLANFFDAMGSMTGLGKQAGLMDAAGELPGLRRALTVEGVGAIAGGVGSCSSNTVFVESAAGIGEGARTGLASVVTGCLFLVAMFFTPLYEIVPAEAAAPALVIVGALMMGHVREVDFSRFEVAFPAFLTIVAMPFTYSIANGIGLGCVSWVLIRLGTGKIRQVHPLLIVVALAFLVNFASGPIRELLH